MRRNSYSCACARARFRPHLFQRTSAVRCCTRSRSGAPLRKRVKETHKAWLPVSGVLEAGNLVDAGQLQDVANAWTSLVKLTNIPSQKSHYKPLLKIIIAKTESE